MRPDVSKIYGNLWLGSAPLSRHGYEPFDVIYFAAQEYQPPEEEFPGHIVRHYGFDDIESLEPGTIALVRLAARHVVSDLDKGRKVLVTCLQGRNRSAFIVALALHLMTGEAGAACAKFVRKKRPNAGGYQPLTNEAFYSFLVMLPAG